VENRYVDRFYSVFDIPQHAGLDDSASGGGRKATRVMMFYDRAKNRRTFQILNRDLSEKARKQIEIWLAENTETCDTISGLNGAGP